MLKHLRCRVAPVRVYVQHVLQKVAKFGVFAWIEGADVLGGQRWPVFHPIALESVLGKGIETSDLRVGVHEQPFIVAEILLEAPDKTSTRGRLHKYLG